MEDRKSHRFERAASRRRTGVLRGIFCVALSMSLPALAIDSSECGTPAQITARMKAEGQRSFAMADEVRRKNDLNSLYGMVYTVNADFSVGYILQSDQPAGEPASKICIHERLENIRLFDARKPGVDPASLLKADESAAKKRCDELAQAGKVKGVCGSLGSFIRDAEPFGERVILQGFITERQADGTYKKDGTLATVTGNIGGSLKKFPDNPTRGIVSAIFVSSLPEGATIINMFTVYAEYLPYGLELLERRGG